MNDSNATSKFPKQHSDDGLKTLSIAIFLANGLVFVLFYRCSRLRTSSNYVLLSLAICDFSTGVIAIPYFIVYNFGIFAITIKYWGTHLAYITSYVRCLSHTLYYWAQVHGNGQSTETLFGD